MATIINLRKQVRQGIARILVDNILFGDDLGNLLQTRPCLIFRNG